MADTKTDKPSTGSEMGWTPEPWSATEQVSRDGVSLGWIIDHANGRIGWSSYATEKPNQGEGRPFPISAANAARIVSCVNAMAGIPDPAAFVSAVRAAVEAGAIDEVHLSLIRSALSETTKPAEEREA